MKRHFDNKLDKWLLVLDVAFYVMVFVMIVVFFSMRHSNKWLFLCPAGVALFIRISSYIMNQINKKNL